MPRKSVVHNFFKLNLVQNKDFFFACSCIISRGLRWCCCLSHGWFVTFVAGNVSHEVTPGKSALLLKRLVRYLTNDIGSL